MIARVVCREFILISHKLGNYPFCNRSKLIFWDGQPLGPRPAVDDLLAKCDIAQMSRGPHGITPPMAGNRIRELRLRKRLSIQALAKDAGTSFQTLQRWETTGKIPVKKLPKLAEVLGVTPSDLLPGSEGPKVADLTTEQRFLLDRFEAASPETRRAILKSVKGLTDHED